MDIGTSSPPSSTSKPHPQQNYAAPASTPTQIPPAASVATTTAAVNVRRSDELVARASEREAYLEKADFSTMELKDDHKQRPCWTCPDGRIFLEAFNALYDKAYEFLVTIAEPVARPELIHEYKLTPYSLYAAVATNIETESIITVLHRFSKNALPASVEKFIRDCTTKYGKVRLVLKEGKYYVESEFPAVLRDLLRDPIIAQARIHGGADRNIFQTHTKAEEMKENLQILKEPGDDESDEEEMEETAAASDSKNKRHKKPTVVVSFQVDGSKVENVKRQAIELDYPLMEEYDFRNDRTNHSIPLMDLKPETRIRHYQERSLAKMFGNGRARSGIIVLPCGAGKTLTGVTAAQTIKKSCVCLATNSVSVLQWKYQFQKWTNIPDDRIAVFTSDRKDKLHPEACVLITTYTMISFSGKRTEEAQQMLDEIKAREWGLLLMDEVHVVPAKMFRRVIGAVKAHCRLGLTATLVREDGLIKDLNFLVGPKLYEANWMDLTTQGYLANVQCVEVWCPMTRPFMKEHLMTKSSRFKEILYVMNPSKLRAVEYLVRYHEERGDKIIIFSDLLYSLQVYAKMLKRPMIYGSTPEWERRTILGLFRRDTGEVRTICLSKVGDTSIDLPEANVIIQVSSHFGARRKEAQRLGRILRPKSHTKTDGSNRSSFNAFFYSLVSLDTMDTFYSHKRQQYLIDQGYTYKIETELSDKATQVAEEQNYSYATPEDDLDLLRKIKEGEYGDEQGAPDRQQLQQQLHPLFRKRKRV